MKRLRSYFITGLVVLLPLAATWWTLRWLFSIADGLLAGPLYLLINRGREQPISLPGLGALVTILLILLVGMLAANYIGRRAIRLGEAVLLRIPIVRSIYQSVKQTVDAFTSSKQTAFQRVAAVEYPRHGLWTVGFVTGRAEVNGRTLISVFLPTTPNPTSGWLVLLPPEDVRILDLSVEAGLRMIISGGVAIPGSQRLSMKALSRSEISGLPDAAAPDNPSAGPPPVAEDREDRP